MKRHYLRLPERLFLASVLIALSACGGLSTPAIATFTPTQAPVSQGLVLSSTTISETSASPVYTLSALVPVLTGSNDPRVMEFNQEVAVLVQQAVMVFKQSMAGTLNPPIANGSYFNLKYTLISPWGDLLSLKFDIDFYYDGAAHPGQSSQAFTFDLGSGHMVNLDQLFQPGMSYLQVLSDYCKTELAGRNIAFDSSITGADPLPDNYRDWNVSTDGLVITFDAYQVAAYAAGPQIITIPYTKLAGILDPSGPLAGLLP